MALLEDLEQKVYEYAVTSWEYVPNARVIPTPDDLTFGNTAERLDATVLYADIRGSTAMVDALPEFMAAEYYKAFLHCAAKIIKANSGVIQAYDGDRVMAVFVGDTQADNAVRTALKIHHAVRSIINPTFSRVYNDSHRVLSHTVGIDKGKILVAKTGVRVDSDLVWVGAAANYAAKLNSFPGSEKCDPTRITESVYSSLSESLLFAKDGSAMWHGPYTDLKRRHFRSRYWIPVV